jgi:hypothetical protein
MNNVKGNLIDNNYSDSESYFKSNIFFDEVKLPAIIL